MTAYIALGLAVLGTAVLGVLRPLLTDEARGLLVYLAHYLVARSQLS
jgi:uncharacterized membrane protein YbaN (DUF454 family)